MWGGVNGCISHLGVYQQVHHRLGMDKYGLLHTLRQYFGTCVPVLLLAGQPIIIWRQWRSNAVLVDRRQESGVATRRGGQVSLGRQSSALQRHWRLGEELTDGRQAIVAEGVDNVLVAAEWSPCPGSDRFGGE